MILSNDACDFDSYFQHLMDCAVSSCRVLLNVSWPFLLGYQDSSKDLLDCPHK